MESTGTGLRLQRPDLWHSHQCMLQSPAASLGISALGDRGAVVCSKSYLMQV